MRTRHSLSPWALVALGALLAGGCSDPGPGPDEGGPSETQAASEDQALQAYATVYSVLTHPRCMNCHPAGDRPLQHDDSRPHAMNVQRGPENRGRAGMRCVTCHQQENHALEHLPPGNSVWRLAPPEQAFEGRSPRALALQLTDPEQSHMTLEELIHHVEDDALVGWGWNPGPGRTPVPTPREEFVAAFRTWVQGGTPIPAERSK